MSTQLLEDLLEYYSGWEAAIADAQQKAMESEQKAVRLKAVADVLKRKRDAGEQWPGTLTEDSATRN
jgi:hypothetical protein